MRSGTLATHQIVGLGEAARIAREEMAQEAERVIALRQRFWDGIKHMVFVPAVGSRPIWRKRDGKDGVRRATRPISLVQILL